MSSVLNQTPSLSFSLSDMFAPIAGDLAAVDELLRRKLRSPYPCVDELAAHAFRLGGKRLRPALLLLCARACGDVNAEHIKLAAVVEMIHTATLVHDDILDEADVRRHHATVNARWGNESSVLLGDYLFTHAFYLASTTGSTYACQAIGRATNITCEGELRQVRSAGNDELSEHEYFGIIESKTAELCSCACQLGGHFAAAGEEVEGSLARYGRRLGVAFQIIDDLLDLTGNQASVGKSLGTDLEKRKATLPLIRLLAQADDADRRELLELLKHPSRQRAERLLPLLRESGALESARETAASYIRQAVAELDLLPASPARGILIDLAEFVLLRQK